MTNYTKEQLELKQYIVEDNRKAIEDGMMFTMTECLDHWSRMDVFNVEQYKKLCVVESYIDIYKDINGIKPRWVNFDAMSYEDVAKELDDMIQCENQARETEVEKDRRYQAEQKERNKYIPNNAFSGLNLLLKES
jgi:hypothetical protein